MDLGGIHPGWYVGTTWWNLLKEDLRRVAKKFEKEERQDKKARLNLLMMTQEHIAGKVERGSLHHLPELRKTQKEICHWFDTDARKVILHGRIRDAVDSEKTRIYHHEKLFKTFERNKIDKLQLEGEICPMPSTSSGTRSTASPPTTRAPRWGRRISSKPMI